VVASILGPGRVPGIGCSGFWSYGESLQPWDISQAVQLTDAPVPDSANQRIDWILSDTSSMFTSKMPEWRVIGMKFQAERVPEFGGVGDQERLADWLKRKAAGEAPLLGVHSSLTLSLIKLGVVSLQFMIGWARQLIHFLCRVCFPLKKASLRCLNLNAPQPQPQSFQTINETWEAVYDPFLFLNMNQICNLLDVGLYRDSFSVQPEPFSRKKRPQSPPPGFRDTNPTTRNETHIVELTTKRSDSYPATIRPSDMCSAVVPVKTSSIGQVRDPVHATQAHQSNTGCHLPTETTTQQQPL
jgi:hypothetical protein